MKTTELDKLMLALKTNLHHKPELTNHVEDYITKLESEKKGYLDQLLDTRHKNVQQDYTIQNQAKVIENTGKALERFTKENKALRELVSLWV